MAIGAAAGPGRFEINKRAVAGTGTVQSGDEIRTAAAPSTVRLSSGTRLELAPRSAVSVYEGRAALVAGSAELRPGRGFELEASALRISAESPAATKAVVRQLEGGKVLVATSGGSYRVKNASGMLIARVLPGQPLLFAPGGEQEKNLILHGKLEAEGGNFFLTDETAAVRFQLRGQDLARFQGKRVQVHGKPGTGANTVEVTSISQTDDKKKAAAAAGAGGAAGAAGAAGTAGAAGAAGAAAGISGAVVAGVGVAAATAVGVAVKAASGDGDAPVFTPQTISQ